MGLKIKAGMAMTGLVLSWFFGLNGLSGIASYVDSTGNILVDIADGIGLVSKGIEALESYLESKPALPSLPEAPAEPTNPPEKDVPDAPEANPTPTHAPSPAPPTPVICRKGKCTPYDPSKDRVLQAQLIRAERERILQQVKSGELPADTVLPKRFTDDDFDEDDYRMRRVKVPKREVEKAVSQKETDLTEPVAPGASIQIAPGNSESEKRRDSVDILNPHDPDIPLIPANLAEGNFSEDSPATNSPKSGSNEEADPPGRWRVGVKRVLGSLAGMTARLKTLLLKVVTTVFPWNRRAKRRLTGGDGEDDE
ncbi:titin-like [Tigriopus californicus]|uniref:titin-like n=1 Tax=Tigriopus californicus TaxID=6832 RepID=UPI0027D9F819|nr:titin-like [Tigriopus californicus]|eukprot:TCALIF_12373-PA protein Name:"Protein of unknown function" AED:0.09 eAED:0.09 QI:84/1/0.8/1/1/1/5/0/309